jgi:hypothetical protein
MPKSPLAGVAPRCKYHVDIRVFAVILVIARTNDQNFGISESSILKAMPIAFASFESGAFPGLERFLSRVRHQYDFSFKHVDELVFM